MLRSKCVSLAILACVAVSGCGGNRNPNASASVRIANAPTSAITDRPCTKVDVAQRLSKIRQDKVGLRPPTDGPVANAGDWAFASGPVNIAGPGSYMFRFGPLTREFDLKVTVTGFHYIVPEDFPGELKPIASKGPHIVSADGSRYLEAVLEAHGNGLKPCNGLIVFIG
jgi:hypothetical protein